MIELVEYELDNLRTMSPVCIKVVGVGGAGGNMVNSIVESDHLDIECITVNTDVQALNMSLASERIHIGVKSTKGLGTGANPDIGERAAQEDLEKVMHAIGTADIVFLVGGLGGGTGSGGMPVIAQALWDRGVLCIAIVTKPFAFEGKKRTRVATEAVERLKKVVDTLIVMHNQKLLEVTDKQISMIDAFAMENNVLVQSVRSIADIIAKPGHINVDFADVRAIMKGRGFAVMGTGRANGVGRAQEAAFQAISSPLLENMSITGARGILLNITGGPSLGLHEINEAASIVYQEAHEDANIIIGSVIDNTLSDDVLVTIIATGFEEAVEQNWNEHDSDLLAEEAIRAAHELVEALKTETQKVKEETSSAPTQPMTCDQNLVHAIVQEVLKEVYRSEKAIAVSATHLPTEQDQDVACAVQNDEGALQVQENNIDIHDLDVPTYLRQEVIEQSQQ
jgi:cell division protein FtsZ